MTANEKRNELQQEAINTLLLRKRVIVNWGTGVGKSRVGIGCADRLYTYGHDKILLLVGETAHKLNWRNEFMESLGEARGNEVFSHITVECYNSLEKYEWTKWDLIIADEAHHLRSEKRTDSISTINTEYFLCLTATMSCKGDADDLLCMLEMANGKFVNLNFGIQDAIDNEILKEPKIYVHFLSLEDFKIRQEIVEEWGTTATRLPLTCVYEDCFKYYNRDKFPAARLTIMATPKQAYEYYTEKMKRAKSRWRTVRIDEGIPDGAPDSKRSAWEWNKYVQYGTLRKIVLGKSKTTFSKWLLGKIRDKKYVCFCSDVEQAEILGGDNIIHSGLKNNMDTIEAYNRGDIRSLFAVNMIQEGQNLAGIQVGVVIQLGGKERQFVQKFGRALRSQTPEQHIVVIINSRDEKYYENAVEGLNPKYIIKRYYGKAKELKEASTGNVPGAYNGSLPGLSRAVAV